jgi:hypothetical protein
MTRITCTLLALAVLVSACGSGGEAQTEGDPPAPVETAAAPVDEAELEGTWRRTVTREAIEDGLREAGLGDAIQPMRANTPPDEPPHDENTFTLHLRDGVWRLEWETPELPRGELDRARYEVDGDTVTYIYGDERNAWRWQVDDDDELSLEWLEELPPDLEIWPGVPAEAFILVLYGSPFERVEG